MSDPNQPGPKKTTVFEFLIDLSDMVIEVEDVDSDNRTCPICIQPYDDNRSNRMNAPVKLWCGHIFDIRCLLEWLSIHSEGRNTCPMCRKPLFYNFSPELKIDVIQLRQFLVAGQVAHQSRMMKKLKDEQ